MQKKLYVVFEGITGSGKGTQADLLAEKLLGFDVVTTREPGGDEIAEAIRRLVQGTEFTVAMEFVAEAYLYAAARAQSLRSIVQPALKRDAVVIADRSVFSSIAFQGGGRNLGVQTVLEINAHALGALKPDCVIHLALPCELALSRTFDQDGDKFERETLDFHRRCDAAYHEIGRHPDFVGIWNTIDGVGDIDVVAERVWAVVQPLVEEWQTQGE